MVSRIDVASSKTAPMTNGIPSLSPLTRPEMRYIGMFFASLMPCIQFHIDANAGESVSMNCPNAPESFMAVTKATIASAALITSGIIALMPSAKILCSSIQSFNSTM